MSSDVRIITNPKFQMWIREDGIVQLVWVPGESLDFDDAVAVTEAVAALTGGRSYPLLVDARGGGSLDRRARAELARGTTSVPAVAMIVDTPLNRMMGNFVLAAASTNAPNRMFDDEAPAVAWLTEFVS
jgi:hypothetical protein